jgi:hypothetical protein
VNAPYPARQVALVSKSRPGCDFSEAKLPVPHKLDRMLQSQMHNITVRRHTDGSGEHAGEVEQAPPCDSRERGHFDRFVQVGNDIILVLIKEFLAERASRPGWRLCSRFLRHATDVASSFNCTGTTDPTFPSP